MINKWDLRFLRMAELVAGWSKDPSTKCGAVIVRPDKSIASVGYNGFPRGCSDASHLYENRELKYERVVHAEMNAILAAKESLVGCTMYTWPRGLGPSCARCSAHIIQAGLHRVVHIQQGTDFANRWGESAKIGLTMFQEAAVQVIAISGEEYDRVG
jgi:dCMP deaminase